MDPERPAAPVHVPGRLIMEVESALHPTCDLPGCVATGYAPATWRVRVAHSPQTCLPEELLICSKCREALHRVRHREMQCETHGGLGISVANWWTPLGVLP